MSHKPIKFTKIETYYIVYDSESGQLADTTGGVEGWFNYADYNFDTGHSLVITEMDNVMLFSTKPEAEACADNFRATGCGSFEVIEVNKTTMEFFSLEH